MSPKLPMEWSTESVEKVICFVQERPFLFDVSSAELAWTCTKIWCNKNLCKFLAQVSWLCVTTIISALSRILWMWSYAAGHPRMHRDNSLCVETVGTSSLEPVPMSYCTVARPDSAARPVQMTFWPRPTDRPLTPVTITWWIVAGWRRRRDTQTDRQTDWQTNSCNMARTYTSSLYRLQCVHGSWASQWNCEKRNKATIEWCGVCNVHTWQ